MRFLPVPTNRPPILPSSFPSIVGEILLALSLARLFFLSLSAPGRTVTWLPTDTYLSLPLTFDMNNVCQVSTQPSAATTALAVATFCHRRRRRHFSPLSFRQRCALRLRPLFRPVVGSLALSLSLRWRTGSRRPDFGLRGGEERDTQRDCRPTKGRAAPGRTPGGMPLALPAPNAWLVLCERIARHRHLTGNVGSGGKRGGLDAGALALFVLARYLARRSLTWLLAYLLTWH